MLSPSRLRGNEIWGIAIANSANSTSYFFCAKAEEGLIDDLPYFFLSSSNLSEIHNVGIFF